MTEDQIKQMAERFLNWKLPDGFNPDCGITFDKSKIHPQSWPTGTNLIGYTEAVAMVRHMVVTITKCQWCGETHGIRCPLVKAIEYENGTVKRVEFYAPNDYAPRSAFFDPNVHPPYISTAP